jgi:cytochrome c553
MNVTDRLPGNRCDSWIGALAVLLLGAFVFPTLAFSQNTITLPIEVYPDDGRSSHVESVTINASNGSATSDVYFVMHQPFYHLGGWDEEVIPQGPFDRETMVDVRLNGGPWVQVRDENVTCADAEQYHGCVASGYATMRFSMSAADLGTPRDGANTLEFRFNGTEGVRSGFRVLYIGFMRPANDVNTFEPLPAADATDTLIDGTTFQHWDPDSWSAPSGYEGSSFVSAGEALWSSEGILVDLQDEPITAACGTCHGDNGRDLQYFAFSNKSIIARSQSHGLTEDEGKKIAAYIRSLQFTLADGTTPAETNSPGTPWDPPYQPGPTGYGPNGNQHPDEADPYYWAAGAGWEWALDDDMETVQYAFPASGDPANPGGINYMADGSLAWERYEIVDESEWGDNGGTDRGTAVNMREIPVSIQFPDWNNWLPDIAPIDGIPAFAGSDYQALLEEGRTTVFPSGDAEAVDNWKSAMNGQYFSEIKGKPTAYAEPLAQHAILGGVQHRAVKSWDFQHRHHMEDKADELHCDGSEQEWCEPLGWLGDMRTLFEMAPHVAGTDFDAAPYVYGSKNDNNYFNHVWYQIQMVVNPGTAGNGGQTPVDEGYQEAFLEAGCGNGGCGIRQTLSEWKLFQLYSNDLNERGGIIPGNTEMDRVLKVVATGWRKNGGWDAQTNTPERKAIVERVIEAFIRATNTYMVGENGSPGRLATVERLSGSEYGGNGFVWPGIEYQFDTSRLWLPQSFDYAAQIYSVLAGRWKDQDETFANFFPNMSRGAIDSLAAQGDLIVPDDRNDGYSGEVANGWPSDLTRWHDLVDYTPPSTGSQTIGLGQGWNLISSRINPSDPAVESVFGGVDSDLSLVKNEAGDIYSPGVGLNNIGDWQSREGYLVYMTNSQSMSVSGYGVDPATSFMLEEGWNLIPYYPETAMTPADAFASISAELVLVKNQAGETYVPDPQDPIDDIGQLQPGQAYKVYVSSPVSFSYPSSN